VYARAARACPFFSRGQQDFVGFVILSRAPTTRFFAERVYRFFMSARFTHASWLRTLLLGFAAAGLALAAAARAAEAAVRHLDRILVVVNDEVITTSELGRRLAQTKKQLALERIPAPPDEILERQLLERMILERLQLQAAERAGIRVPEAEVEQALEAVARRNQLSVEAFLRALEREGLDPALYREEIRRQLVIRRLVEREIRDRIYVSEAEVEALLERRAQDPNTAYRLSHIFLPLPESASPETIEATRRRAEDIVRQLRAGASFAELAIAHSQGPEALQGGDLGWKTPGQLPELFLAALEKLAPGEVSDPLRGPNGFHILRLDERRGGGAEPLVVTQTHVRHILLRPSAVLTDEEARARLAALRERLRHGGEDFAALARAHSEDHASAAEGGDLGWVNPGTLAPEFERAMNALAPGEVSAPVRTAFGWHLIQVLERRTQDISREHRLAQARQEILARKTDERYEQWLRQLRDEAYVEYLPEE
jgi:peptidyl-prolyl cis-trans isomerase SurA